jgi:glucosamine kinase
VSRSPLYLGIDGGGTACKARLTDADGRLIGNGLAGPANLTTDGEGAARAIVAAARAAGLGDGDRVYAVFGLAGANARPAAERLAAHPFPFVDWLVTTDADTALRGAHAGAPGAILILGTGSQGYGRRADGSTYRVGGWGFALSDGASGAVVGHRAARWALAAGEGLAPSSPFTAALMARFDDDPAVMLAWAVKAVPRDWASLTPLVFDYAAAGDAVAGELRRQAVGEVEALIERLAGLGAERLALTGGLATSYRPHIGHGEGRLAEPVGDALDGALAMARQRWPG